MIQFHEFIIEVSLKKKCRFHPEYFCDLLYLEDKQENSKVHQICLECSEDRNYPLQQIVDLEEIFDQAINSTISKNYVSSKLFNQFVNLSNLSKEMIRELGKFFKQFFSESKQSFKKQICQEMISIKKLFDEAKIIKDFFAEIQSKPSNKHNQYLNILQTTASLSENNKDTAKDLMIGVALRQQQIQLANQQEITNSMISLKYSLTSLLNNIETTSNTQQPSYEEKILFTLFSNLEERIISKTEKSQIQNFIGNSNNGEEEDSNSQQIVINDQQQTIENQNYSNKPLTNQEFCINPIEQKIIDQNQQQNCIEQKNNTEMDEEIEQIQDSFELNLHNKPIGDKGVGLIVQKLSSLQHILSVSLDLGLNQIFAEKENKDHYGLSEPLSLPLNAEGNFNNTNCITSNGALVLSYGLGSLKQLQGFTLNIFGNRIGNEGISSLFSQLFHQQNIIYMSLNLGNNNISSEGVTSLSLALLRLTKMKSLSLKLSGNIIGLEGISSLSNGLSKLQNLTNLSLSLNECCLNQQGVISLSSGLAGLQELSSLSLDLSFSNFGKSGYQSLSKALYKLEKLKSLTLNLMDCNIGNQEIQWISESLIDLNQLTSLSLNLSSNEEIQIFTNNVVRDLFLVLIDFKLLASLSLYLKQFQLKSKDIKALSLCFQKLTNIKVLNLDLSSSLLKGEEISLLLSESLSKCKILTSLSFNLNFNEIGISGVASLFSELTELKNLTSLELDLSDNEIHQKGASIISSGLSQMNKLTSLILNLQYCEIGSQGTAFLSKGIAELTQLTHLELNISSNQIDSSGAISLSSTFSHLNKLSYLSLNISNNTMKEDGIIFLLGGLFKISSLTTLSLNSYNSCINDKEFIFLSQELPKLRLLCSLTLNLSNNFFYISGLDILSYGLSQLRYLSTLSLDLSSCNFKKDNFHLPIISYLRSSLFLSQVSIKFTKSTYSNNVNDAIDAISQEVERINQRSDYI